MAPTSSVENGKAGIMGVAHQNAGSERAAQLRPRISPVELAQGRGGGLGLVLHVIDGMAPCAMGAREGLTAIGRVVGGGGRRKEGCSE